MVAKKRSSKRQTLQQKYKIIKRTKQHHKKLKKGAIAVKGNKKSKINENRIPNEWPYKEQLLKEVQAAKDKMEEVKLRSKEKRQEEVNKKRAETAKKIVNDALLNASASVEVAEDVNDSLDIKAQNLGQNSRRAYLGELRKVVESADVILHVLDARDPLGTRSTAIEDMVLADHRKKLVFVLNKADLIPRNVLSAWLTFLRKSHPTIPFKCNTQSQKDNLGRSSAKMSKQEDSLKTTQAVGAEDLLGLLKNYCRQGEIKSIISVGVVGFPNVGKSSLVNSLMRTRAVGVSSMPGFTKQMQEVVLDKNIRLLDSPGIVFADGNTSETALRNCINVEAMEDVITPVQAILERCPQPYLMQLYSIPKFKLNDCTAFLALVARATGKLKKGGIPNIEVAARSILHDWNDGRIKYYCRPPKLMKVDGIDESDSMVLSSFSETINVDGLEEADIRAISALEAHDSDMTVDFVGVDSLGSALAMAHDIDITTDNKPIQTKTSVSTKKKNIGKKSKRTDDSGDGMVIAEENKGNGLGGVYDFETDFTY
eukprot:gene12393-26071_t